MKPTLITALLLAPLAALLAADNLTVADFRYAPPNLGTGKLPPPLPPSTRYVTVNRGSDDPEVRPPHTPTPLHVSPQLDLHPSKAIS